MSSKRIQLVTLHSHSTPGLVGRVIKTQPETFYIDRGSTAGGASYSWLVLHADSASRIVCELVDVLVKITENFKTADAYPHGQTLDCPGISDIWIEVNEKGDLIAFGGDRNPEEVRKEQEQKMQMYLLVRNFGIF